LLLSSSSVFHTALATPSRLPNFGVILHRFTALFDLLAALMSITLFRLLDLVFVIDVIACWR
jgi:hypothetical protein